VQLGGGEEVKVAQSEGSLYFSHSLAFIEGPVSFYFPVPSLLYLFRKTLPQCFKRLNAWSPR